MKYPWILSTLIVAAAACLSLQQIDAQTGNTGGAPKKAPMITYDTPYYKLTTDLSPLMARETDLRMTRMYEEYRHRTAGFSGDAPGKFPFFMFRNEDDYYAAGGPTDSAGVFMPMSGKLMAIGGDQPSQTIWHRVQHEGFHQFAAATIHAELPTWLNEGLAEYFGYAIFTGDSFVTGKIPSNCLKEIRDSIEHKKWKSFAAMTNLSLREWNKEMTGTNYMQAWAMVHFLAHGEPNADGKGKYQDHFVAYIKRMNAGASAASAWSAEFGNDIDAFEAKCHKWWLSLPEYPTQEIYIKAYVSGMTSILARTEAQKQTFADFDAFVAGARPTDMKLSRDLWLPPSLVEEVTTIGPRIGKWKLDKPLMQNPRLICVTKDGTTYTGTFTLSGKHVDKVSVTIVHGPATYSVSGASITTMSHTTMPSATMPSATLPTATIPAATTPATTMPATTMPNSH